jgi:hypothetical protein
VDNLESYLRARNDPRTENLDGDLRNALETELASALGGLTWRIRSTFDNDVQLAEAVKVLGQRDRYVSLLRGAGRAEAPENKESR